MRLDFKKPLSSEQDFTYLPDFPSPIGITLSFSPKEYSREKARQIREQLAQFGQKEVESMYVDPYGKIDESDLRKGNLRVHYRFGDYPNRRNCSFELEPERSPFRQMFEQGLLPYHIDQTLGRDKHYCITDSRLPLIPVAVDERINSFIMFYNNLGQLPQETYNRLFKGIPLPAKFSISYGGDPHVSMYANFGGRVLGMDVLDLSRSSHSSLDPEKTAESIATNMDLFNHFYDNYKKFKPEVSLSSH